jgi:hypothetical protein
VWIANHPPLTSVLAAPPAWLAAELAIERGPQMVLRLLCASGMAVGVLASAAVADVLLPGRRRTAILAAGLVALTPSVLSIASYGYNDGLALATGTSLLAVSLRVARTGPSRARLVATLALGPAAVLTRSSLLPLIALAVVVWGVRAAMDRDRRGVGAALLVALEPALAGGWFYLRNLDLYGDLTGASYLQDKFGRDPQGSTWELLADPVFLVGAWQDLWARYPAAAPAVVDRGAHRGCGPGLAPSSPSWGWRRSWAVAVPTSPRPVPRDRSVGRDRHGRAEAAPWGPVVGSRGPRRLRRPRRLPARCAPGRRPVGARTRRHGTLALSGR